MQPRRQPNFGQEIAERRKRPRTFQLFALLTALVLVAAACGSTGTDSVATTAEPGAGDTTPNTQADTGGTETTATTEADTGDPDPVTLSLLHSYSLDDPRGPIMEEIIQTVMDENPWITFDVEILPGIDIPPKVSLLYVGEEEPDVVLVNLKTDTIAWWKDGISVPVTEFVQDWDVPTLNETSTNQYTFEDDLIAIPYEGFTWPIWYNTAILEEAGVGIPTTIDELKAAIPAIIDAGYAPFTAAGADWPGHALWNLVVSLYMTDQDIMDVYPVGGFADNEGAVKGMDLWVELRDMGFFSELTQGLDRDAMRDEFFAGEAAMMLSGAWSFEFAPEDMRADIELGGFPLPADTVRDRPVMFGGYDAKGVFVTRNGSEPDKLAAIQKFVEVMYRPEVVGQFVESGMLPPTSNAQFDQAALNELFVKSLDLPGQTELAINSSAYRNEEVGNPAYLTVTEIAFDNGVSAQEILEAFDNLFE